MATVRSTLKLNDKMSGALTSITRAMGSTLSAIRSIEGVNLGAEFAQAAADVKLAEQAVEDLVSGLGDVPQATKRAGDGYTMMKGIAVNALSAIARSIKNAVGDVIRLTDEMTSATARLDLIAGAGESVAAIQGDIFRAAQRSRGEYLGMVDSVAKLRLLAGDAFRSTEESIKFAEQLNKQYVIAGTSAGEAANATRQIVQALSAGRLQGDEFRSVMENAPLYAQAIADYMNLSVGELRKMSSEGLITADILKNAMFAAAEETNAKFAEMPMTIGQIWTAASNNILIAAQPLLEGLASAAQWIYENWSSIEPVLVGVAVGVGAVAAAWGIYTAVTWLSVAANQALIASLLANPLIWIAVLIAGVVTAIYKWVQAVGGIDIAWKIVVDAMLMNWDRARIAFFKGISFVLGLMENLKLGWKTAGTAIANFIGDMKVNVLTILQNMINGAIDLINDFVNLLNKIPGVNIGLVEHVTFAATAAAENEAAKQARESELAVARATVEASKAARDADIARMQAQADWSHFKRQQEIKNMQSDVARAARDTEVALNSDLYTHTPEGLALKTAVSGDVKISDDNLKLLLDLATRSYADITYQVLEPQLNVNVDTIRETADVDEIINTLADGVEEMADASLYV